MAVSAGCGWIGAGWLYLGIVLFGCDQMLVWVLVGGGRKVWLFVVVGWLRVMLGERLPLLCRWLRNWKLVNGTGDSTPAVGQSLICG